MSKLVVSTIETQNVKFDSDTTAATINSSGSVNFPVGATITGVEKTVLVGTQAMSGLTEKIFTGIPSNARRVRLTVDGTYKDGSQQTRIRIGDSSGIKTSGYDFRVNSPYASGSVYTEGRTAGVDTYMDGASGTGYTVWGFVDITPLITSNRYLFDMNLYSNNNYYINLGLGHVDLSGAMDRIQFTTQNGTQTFGGGSIKLEYMV
tara:strand:- start:831 stop:1445 length:615 start_codon:yes stop_codon:yes gene_type:complete